jgi:hypothetical protein
MSPTEIHLPVKGKRPKHIPIIRSQQFLRLRQRKVRLKPLLGILILHILCRFLMYPLGMLSLGIIPIPKLRDFPHARLNRRPDGRGEHRADLGGNFTRSFLEPVGDIDALGPEHFSSVCPGGFVGLGSRVPARCPLDGFERVAER